MQVIRPRLFIKAAFALLASSLLFSAPVCLAAGETPVPGPEEETQSVAFFYKNAQRAIQNKNYAEALEAIENGLERSPGYMPFMWQKALVLTRLGRHEEAYKITELAMSAMPDNVELNGLAVENILALKGGNQAELERALSSCFKKAGRNALPQLVARLVETYSDGNGRLKAILRALDSSEALEARDRPLLKACLDNNPELAATLIKSASGGLEPRKPRARLIAAFSFLSARSLQSKKRAARATEMYDLALTLGYDREKLIADWAETYMSGREPLMAAKLYESYWRDSSRPQLWAARAAEARRAGGQTGRAVDDMRKAEALLPDDPFVQGQYLFYLNLGGGLEETRAYAERLEKRGEKVGLNYGRYLIARENKDYEAINETRTALLDSVRHTTSVHPQASIRHILEGLNLTTKVPEMSHQADLLREAGWKLWDEKKSGEAFIHWRDAVSVDPERNRSANANIILLLMQSGMTAQAMEIYRMMFPDTPEFALAVMLMRSGQWPALRPLLSSMKPGGDFAAWHALGMAYSGLKSGAPRAAVEADARKLLALSPPSKNLACELPDRDSGMELFTLDQKYYNTILKDFFTELFRQGYSGLVDEALQSRQFRLVPARAGAHMLADAAFDLTSKDAVEEAAPLWRAAHKLDPSLPEANMGLALLEKISGNKAAFEEYMRLASGADSLKMEYIKGRICLVDGQVKEAAGHFRRYLKGERGNFSAAYQLFNLLLGMRDYAAAREIRSYFSRHKGNSEALLYLALCNQGLGYYKNAEKVFREILKKNPSHIPATQGLVACLRAQDRLDEAEALLEKSGLEDPEVLTVLRHKAERALKAEEPEEAEEYAQRYLAREPDSIYMNDVYNRSLRERHRLEKTAMERFRRDKLVFDQGRLDTGRYTVEQLEELRRASPEYVKGLKPDEAPLAEAEEHAKSILARNNMQFNAMDSLLDIALQREEFDKAARISRDMARLYPQDPNLALQSAVHMGAISRFDYAFPLAEKMAARGADGAVMAVCFANISSRPREDAYTPRDVEEHLIYFKKNYRFVPLREALGIPDTNGKTGMAAGLGAKAAARDLPPGEGEAAPARPGRFRWERGAASYRYAAGLKPGFAWRGGNNPAPSGQMGAYGPERGIFDFWEIPSKRESADAIPMMLVIGRSNAEELAAIDEILSRHGARAALLVGEESFTPGAPAQYPGSDLLRRLAATGRWEFILTDSAGRTVMRDASGRKANFWGGRAWLGERHENREEMRARWSSAIASAKGKALQQGINPLAWMYPGGDYGQLGLDADDDTRAAYAEAVKDNFFTAFAPSSSGYGVAGADPLRIPVRNLYYPLDDKALAAMPEAHPTRLAVLDEAILASWHGQFPRAEMLLDRSSPLGLSPADIAYNRAANAFFSGDAAYANQTAREALALDPDNPRAEILMERAERMLRPRIAFTPRWWFDDAERDYSEYTLSFSGHINDQLQLSASVSQLSWGYKGNRTEGQAGGLGLRFYPFRQHWLDLAARVVAPNGNGNAFGEFRAAWHGVYAADALKLNGEYNLLYSHEGIETRESVDKGVYADRFALNASMRILNWVALDGDVYSISRTDGNKTWGLSVNPGYILWDKPQLKLGYMFNTATSDRNPPEYYAPLDYVSHVGTIGVKYELFKNFSIGGMFGLGTATSRYKDWRQVLRWQGGISWEVNDSLSLQGGYQRLEMPDYALDQFNLGIQYIF